MACSTSGQSGSELETLGDASLCSVCFEKFKSPRTLPCRHSFCHACLSSAIESSCKEKETPTGFRCPLCREFTPGVGEQKKWVNRFPINDALVNILEISNSKLCGACKTEDEETPGVSYCFECKEALCDACTKYHRKIAPSRSHSVCPLNKAMDAEYLQPIMYKTCQEHTDRPVELVCNDHEQLCCTLCVGTNHRKCKSVDTLDVAAGKIKDSGMIQSLEENMKEYEQKLLRAKHSMEENMDKLDEEADLLTKEMEKMEEDLIAHVRKAKSEALEKLGEATKTSKEKMNISTENIDDQIQCIKKCQQMLTDINTTSDMVKQVAEFFRTKQINQKLQSSRLNKILIMSKVKKGSDVCKIRKQLLFPTLELSEYTNDIYDKVDIRKATLKADVSFSVEDKQIFFGTFLIDGSILLPQYRSPPQAQCLLFNRNGKEIKRISTNHKPLSVCVCGNEIYISCGTGKVIIVLSSETFAVLRSMSTEKPCYGLDIKYDQLYVACMDSIDLMDKNGEMIRSYDVEESVECVIVNNQKMIYSNYEEHIVSAMSTSSQIMWTYESPNLRFPFGIEHDSRDNVYITGKDSNNIHVLSSEGVLLRVFDNIKQPWFIAIPPDDDSTCCICSDNGDMTICRIV
uniref:E3 ubiquitin/ISG15 ligase TRIM25-like n=1 Tax=Crassostrea virginica TaxID=6565 RepID=A0A8B8B1R5_CRAVI|nr:E3 ubiquitin/ISG15 ligase TRIM25-like [Crassostrea virginica]